jgi:hypothetical protein
VPNVKVRKEAQYSLFPLSVHEFLPESFTSFISEDRIVITTDTVECECDELTGVKTTGPLSADKRSESVSSCWPQTLLVVYGFFIHIFHSDTQNISIQMSSLRSYVNRNA